MTDKPEIFSGPESVDLWRRINAIDSESARDAVYALGVKLQELETRLLEQDGADAEGAPDPDDPSTWPVVPWDKSRLGDVVEYYARRWTVCAPPGEDELALSAPGDSGPMYMVMHGNEAQDYAIRRPPLRVGQMVMTPNGSLGYAAGFDPDDATVEVRCRPGKWGGFWAGGPPTGLPPSRCRRRGAKVNNPWMGELARVRLLRGVPDRRRAGDGGGGRR